MSKSKKKQKCIPVYDIVLWTIAGYAAYTAALYVFRKPACQYVTKICDSVNN